MSTPLARWNHKIPGWTALAALNHNSVVKTAPIWLSLVPFLMRELGAHFSIPFNFLAYYFGAIFFGLAYVVFVARCPPLAKLARSHGEFVKGSHSEVDLRNWFRAVVPAPRFSAEADPVLVLQYLSIIRGNQNLTAQETAERLSGKAGHAIMNPFWATSAGSKLADVYDFAKSTTDAFRPGWRLVMTGLYTVGFVFVAMTFVYNAYSAWVYLHGHPFLPSHA
jgi:hypothetical protein